MTEHSGPTDTIARIGFGFDVAVDVDVDIDIDIDLHGEDADLNRLDFTDDDLDPVSLDDTGDHSNDDGVVIEFPGPTRNAESQLASSRLASDPVRTPEPQSVPESVGGLQADPLAVNPRIAARRSDVRADLRRRRLRRAALAGVPLLILCGLLALTRSSLLDVDRIDVRGAQQTSRQAVLATAGVERGQPLTDVDLRAATVAVTELPWVRDVNVERRWPGRIRISIEERVAVASLMADDGTWYLVDAEGYALAQAARPAPALAAVPSYKRPIAVGDVLERDGQSLVAVVSSLPAPIARDTEEVTVSDVAGVELRIGRIRVWVGSEVDLDAKMGALVATLDQVDMAGVCLIDVRVPNFPAVKRRGCS